MAPPTSNLFFGVWGSYWPSVNWSAGNEEPPKRRQGVGSDEHYRSNCLQLYKDYPISASYFIIKPMEDKNVLIGMEQCLWIFAPHTEKKLFKYLNEGHEVILIFAPRCTNTFHGVAKLLNHNGGQPNKPCPIMWLTCNMLRFSEVKSMIHPRLHVNEDGLELDGMLGHKLCTLIHKPSRGCPILGRGNRR